MQGRESTALDLRGALPKINREHFAAVTVPTARTVLDEALGLCVCFIEHPLAHLLIDIPDRAYNRRRSSVKARNIKVRWS